MIGDIVIPFWLWGSVLVGLVGAFLFFVLPEILKDRREERGKREAMRAEMDAKRRRNLEALEHPYRNPIRDVKPNPPLRFDREPKL